jgi:hypothetical protein
LAIGTEDEDSWDRGDAICAEASGIVFESNLAEVIAIDGLQNLAGVETGGAGCRREEVDSRSQVRTGDLDRPHPLRSVESPHRENHGRCH